MKKTSPDSTSACKAYSLFILASVFALFLLFPVNTFGADLFTVVEAGDLNKVKEFVSNGANVNAQDRNGFTPLLLATRHKEIVDFLISQGADINFQGNSQFSGVTPLMRATVFRHKDAVDLLLSRGADINAKSNRGGNTALMSAINEDAKEIAELLILRGADVNIGGRSGRTPLMNALNSHQPEIAKLLIFRGADVNAFDKSGMTPIIFAASGGYKDIIELILAKGADINHKDYHKNTAFLVSLGNNQIELADFVLTKGAHVSDINMKGEWGSTPLMNVAWNGRKSVAEYLINKGANVNDRDYDGRTPLMYTVKDVIMFAPDIDGNIPPESLSALNNRKEVITLLLDKGSDINAEDYDGKTALYFAVINDYYDIAKLLISRGADLKIKDNIGNDALTYVSKNKEMEKLINDNRKLKRHIKSSKMSKGFMKINKIESQQVKATLTNFFKYLHDKKYEKAVPLFEPWQRGDGEQTSGWDGLASFSLQKDRDDKSKVLGHYCESVGTCLRVKILDIKKVDANRYRLKVQFIMDNGKLFALGSCCGAPEEDGPPSHEFVYFVDNIGGAYKVRTPPVYVP